MKGFIVVLFILGLLASAHAKANPNKDGVYVLFSNATGKALTTTGRVVGRNLPLTTQTFHYGSNQAFTVENTVTGWALISGDSTDRYLFVRNVTRPWVGLFRINTTDETQEPSRNFSMHWKFVQKQNGLFAIQSRVSGLFLTVRRTPGQIAVQGNWTGRPNQLFRVMEIAPKVDLIRDGKTYFLLAGSRGLALSVGGESRREGAGITAYPYYGHPSQIFRAIAAINDTGAFHFVNNQTGLALTVNYDDVSGSQVFQSRLRWGWDQKWIVSNMTGGWLIQNKATKLSLKLPDQYDAAATIESYDKGHSLFTPVEVQ